MILVAEDLKSTWQPFLIFSIFIPHS